MLIFEYICIKHFGRRMLFTHKTERREIYWISARAAPIYSQSIAPPPLKIRKCQKILLASSFFQRRKAFFPQECDITVLTKVASFSSIYLGWYSKISFNLSQSRNRSKKNWGLVLHVPRFCFTGLHFQFATMTSQKTTETENIYIDIENICNKKEGFPKYW